MRVCSHGASIASVFDEMLAYPIWRIDHAAYTAQLNINYRDMIPLASTQAFFARVREIRGRRAFLEGSIFNFSPPLRPQLNSSPGDRQFRVYCDSLSVWVISNKINEVSHKLLIEREKNWTEEERKSHANGIYCNEEPIFLTEFNESQSLKKNIISSKL